MANNITPELQAEASPYGILSPASVVIQAGDGAWETKLEYTDYTCNSRTSIEGICIPGITEPITAVDGSGDGGYMHEYRPFSIETEFTCSTIGMTPEEVQERAENALLACRQKAIEVEFSSGLLSKQITEADSTILNPHLTDGLANDVTPTAGTAVDPRTGLALLEQAIADCGCGTRGTVHGQPLAMSFLSKYLKHNKETNEDSYLETRLGNYAISGSGYSGQTPTGGDTSGTQTYLYATGRTVVVLGDVNVYPSDTNRRYEAIDISNNTVRYAVSQTAAVVSSGCCKSAVLVDITK